MEMAHAVFESLEDAHKWAVVAKPPLVDDIDDPKRRLSSYAILLNWW